MYCQQLLSVVKLGGVCMPFGHKVKACTCSETYICIGYVLPTIVDVHLYWIYSANNCGVLFSWGLSVCPSSTRLGHLHVLRYIFILDLCLMASLVASEASEAPSVAPISILMLAIDSASQKTCKKTYHTPKL